ncbi:cobaltochelatase subunit CobN [Rhizobiales bacterium RZME27]|uniref:Cobaltochelatase subunit CobN n=1 Tax=Endobacterium cereale TaxID=2663029 RepID=A0A6A8AGT7_9HYPH|nr:cobaltochelatase subunit CobN [Endobacterium cereale]MEB2847520.1 cobaltochelatase subunit CobN [Endobacterium cereale]MQY48021.1 cobaltochelatase subunit CobN [Endobacterium cereale]
MHILATTSSSLDDLIEPVDLDQTPGDVVVLSFTDSDLNGIASAWATGGDRMPSLRLANISELRHPMSVDLWIDKVARHAKLILVRILGGHNRWPYGADELARMARARGIVLIMLPGECSERDERLAAGATVSAEELERLLSYFREGGPQNLKFLATRLIGLARGETADTANAVSVPKAGFYHPGFGVEDNPGSFLASMPGAAIVPILFYRSMLLASDVAPIDALFDALRAKNILAVPVFVAGLKDKASLAFAETAMNSLKPSVIITATAFASGTDDERKTLFDRLGVPVMQVIVATTRRNAWLENRRGLGPADLAMHVVLPELDGRILAGAISFKDARDEDALGFAGLINRPEPDRLEQVAGRIAGLLRLQRAEREDRRIVILIPDYPGAPGRTGYAVGLDVPQSVLEMLSHLRDAGYDVQNIPTNARDLLQLLDDGGEHCPLQQYRAFFDALPMDARASVTATWGGPEDDEGLRNGVFAFRAARFGNVTVALAPDRGRELDRRTDYHDPERPPRHGLIAFGAWMRDTLDAHAVVHVGAHGTLEWLPGKTVALSQTCFPEIVVGGLPVVYPFIVSNPGEAAVAKRRISAVTIGHLPPPLTEAGLSDAQKKLELLVDEYAQADGLDRRRRDRLAKLIVEMAQETGISDDAGVTAGEDADAALTRIDAFLCDLKDLAIKDGQHVFGRDTDLTIDAPDPMRKQSAEDERKSFLDALDGRHITAGPSGAPARGRRDVLPTGRNLYASDPRTMPTPTAFELGKRAADEVLRRYLQDHGDWPKSLIIDLWGSASLRSGGEEVAQGLALMGARPVQDPTTGRITGIDILPPASLGRPRVDVSFRISGLFRDMFAPLITLLDAATRAIAAREEAPGDNPLSETARAEGKAPQRIFGSAPGTYGAGIEEKLSDGEWREREELGKLYLDATSHAFGGAEGEGFEAQGQFAERVRAADLLVHTGDDPGRDLLDGSADVAFIGGFSAAVAALGGKADVIALDTTDPERPRARSMVEAVTRIVHARATNPRFIAGQMRHGPRGASEFAETVDRLVGFAETTDAIPGSLIEAVYQAYVADENVRNFIVDQNRQAARAIAERFMSARRRGLWHPRRNSVDGDLELLLAEATGDNVKVRA